METTTRNPLASMTEIARDDNALHEYPPLPPSLFMGYNSGKGTGHTGGDESRKQANASTSREELAAFIKEPPDNMTDPPQTERQGTVSELGCFLASIGYIMCCSIGFPCVNGC